MYEDWLAEQLVGMPHGTKKSLAEHLGIDGPKLSKTLSGKRELSAREFALAIDFFGKSPPALSQQNAQRMVPIIGLAGAGPNGSVLFAEGQGNFGEVPAPADAGENASALEVRGDSMHGLANDGWLLFYEERTEPRDEYMGEPCACWLEDGHVLVKIPEPTRYPGLFNLTSTNAATMRDVAVREMALITDIRPRRAAQKFIRRNPSTQVIDVASERRARR